MTTNEKQELNVLSIFIDHKINRFSSMKFPKEITDALGGGSEAIIKNLMCGFNEIRLLGFVNIIYIFLRISIN